MSLHAYMTHSEKYSGRKLEKGENDARSCTCCSSDYWNVWEYSEVTFRSEINGTIVISSILLLVHKNKWFTEEIVESREEVER